MGLDRLSLAFELRREGFAQITSETERVNNILYCGTKCSSDEAKRSQKGDDKMVRVTKEWLESGMKGGVGIKSKQCKILGIPYPPPKGWKYLAIGRLLTDEEAQTFLVLKDKRLRAKTFIEQAGWVKQENPISEKKPKHIVIKVKKRKVLKPQKSSEPKVEESLPVNDKGMITLTQELLKRGSSNGH